MPTQKINKHTLAELHRRLQKRIRSEKRKADSEQLSEPDTRKKKEKAK